MPQALVTLPDGRKAQITFDSQEQLDATVTDLVTHSPPAATKAPAERPQPVGDAATAILEPLASVGSSMIATPLAGLAGLATAGAHAAGLTDAEPADVVRGVRDAMTYQPRTKAGEAVNNAIAFPFEKLADGANYLGEKTADVTGSPALGAAVNTAVQAAPMLLARRGPAPAKVAPRIEPVLDGQPVRTAGQPQVASPAAAEPIAPVAEPVAPKVAPKSDTPEGRAQNYVTSTLGMDWNSLSAGFQSALTSTARAAGRLEKLDAAAVKRQAQLQSLDVPVPATRGDLTRDPVQLRNEGNVSATDAGKPIRDIKLDANQALLDNLDVLKGRVANRTNPAQTPEAVGISVQDSALRAKLALKKKEVSAKYKAAEDAGELQGKVTPKPILQVIAATPDKTHFGWVRSWMDEVGVVKKTDGGTVINKLTLKELEDLRQAAVARAMDGGTEGYYAGKIISAIDQATDGAGGTKYKDARAARRAQALEFEETGAVAQLVENKSRTDRSVALENTWRKTVIGGSIQDLRNVKRSLLTGGDTSTRTAGRVAWRDIKAQTIQHIKDEATKGVALNERGTPNITPAAMKRAVDSIGKAKLDEVFGPGTAQRIDRIVEATRTVKTVPPSLHGGSSTMGNILSFLEKGLGKIPVLGNTASGAVRAGVKLNEMGSAGKIVRSAQDLPIKKAPPPQPPRGF